MKFEAIQELAGDKFRRLTGAQHRTFDSMVKILKEAQKEKKRQGGRHNKLSIEDMLLWNAETF